MKKLQNKLHVLGKPNTQEYCKHNTNTRYNRSGLLQSRVWGHVAVSGIFVQILSLFMFKSDMNDGVNT